jgi:hypothetical protein
MDMDELSGVMTANDSNTQSMTFPSNIALSLVALYASEVEYNTRRGHVL